MKVDPSLAGKVSELGRRGCDLLRFAVPDLNAADILGALADQIELPLVADIHFDHRIAMRCMDFPIAKVRINPGNIGASWKVQEVIRKAKDHGTAVRIGVNSGSLPRSLRSEKDEAAAMVKAAEHELEALEKLDFRNIVVSLKAPDVELTVNANRHFAEKYDFPLHLGVTEAGPLVPGIVKSTAALTQLLLEGIGDTIRVSLSDTTENEVLAGTEILRACGMKRDGVRIISCPTCGRSEFDVQGFLDEIRPVLALQKKSISVAVMGCPVNGPGEARKADIGVTGSGDYAVIFKEGKIFKRIKRENAGKVFEKEIRRLLDE